MPISQKNDLGIFLRNGVLGAKWEVPSSGRPTWKRAAEDADLYFEYRFCQSREKRSLGENTTAHRPPLATLH